MTKLKWIARVDPVEGETVEENVNRWCVKNKALFDKVIGIIDPGPDHDDHDIKLTVQTTVMDIDLFLQEENSELGLQSKEMYLGHTTTFYKRYRRAREATAAKEAAEVLLKKLAEVEKMLTTKYFFVGVNHSPLTASFWAEEEKQLASKNHLAPDLLNDSSFRKALAEFKLQFEREASKTISRGDVPLKDAELRDYVIDCAYNLMRSYSGDDDADKGDRFVKLVRLLGLFKKDDVLLIFERRMPKTNNIEEYDVARLCKTAIKSTGRKWSFSKRNS